MLWSRCAAGMLSGGVVALSVHAAFGQEYPSKALRIVTAAPGASVDLAARVIALGLSGSLGQQVVVDNRGGSGTIAAEAVAKAPPDGYVLLFYGSATWLEPLMRDKTPYDVMRDFSPVTLAVSSPNVLVVHPSVPVKSVRELIALAKARPGALNYASSGSGGSSHLAAELFKSMAAVNIVRVAYRGNAAAVTDLVAGQVQVMFPTAAAAAPHMQSGRLRAVAVANSQPSALLPGLPTVAATGLPGFEAASVNGMFAPAKTPEAIVNRLHQEIVRIINRPEAKEKLLSSGVEIIGSSPAEFAATMKSDIAKWSKVVKAAGIRVD